MKIKNWYLYAIVFITGASILALEILGTRILGPFYGVSTFFMVSTYYGDTCGAEFRVCRGGAVGR